MDDSTTLQKILSSFCTLRFDQIDLSLTIKDRYCPAEEKQDLGNDICDTLTDINCTDLQNQLFSTLKTGNDILNFIHS
ncbi:MAG: hypothetical protein V4577_13750 [Bacteroidota bacterium]